MIWTVWFSKPLNLLPSILEIQQFQLLSRDQILKLKLENSPFLKLLITLRETIWMNWIEQWPRNIIINSNKLTSIIARLKQDLVRNRLINNGKRKSQRQAQDSSMLRSLLKQQSMEVIYPQIQMILSVWDPGQDPEKKTTIQLWLIQELKLEVMNKRIGLFHHLLATLELRSTLLIQLCQVPMVEVQRSITVGLREELQKVQDSQLRMLPVTSSHNQRFFQRLTVL